ncbi:hypothetical protein O3G_MSEX001973 [Manduca sexta]|uniref:Uncharacterized protein n=1 Tax=Manduca sexta TaxID=7130 RepID=A0A921YM82_MANSE|nr:hypothetical protein O3G_MSEX001973 [Manduca sexta]
MKLGVSFPGSHDYNNVLKMESEFNQKMSQLLSRKKSNQGYLMNTVRYQELIEEVKSTKQRRNKDFDDYRLLGNFDVLNISGRERLIQPKDEGNQCLKMYLPIEELFSGLHTVHLLNNHADKDIMAVQVKAKYCNVTKEVIKIYLSCCIVCKKHMD